MNEGQENSDDYNEPSSNNRIEKVGKNDAD